MSVTLDKHCRCAESSSFGGGRRAAAVLCLVEGCSAAALNVRENCLNGPKLEIFGFRVFSQIRPVGVGDLGTRQKNSKF